MPTEPQNDPALEQTHPPIHDEQSVEQKLDVIIRYLHLMNRRDKWRTIWGTFHGFLVFIPMLLTLFSLWYFYTHSAELMQNMMGGMFRAGSTSSQPSIMDQIQEYVRQQQGQ